MTTDSLQKASSESITADVAAEKHSESSSKIIDTSEDERSKRIRIRNRRKTYLDRHPEYFSSELELADPLLYDRLIRQFQTTQEREAEGRAKGYTGVLEADMLRSEAKAFAAADNSSPQAVSYPEGVDESMLAQDPKDAIFTKAESEARWRKLMEWRFLKGDDDQFDYRTVDDNDAFDDEEEQRREAEDRYFDAEEPSWVASNDSIEDKPNITGETGIQDF